MLFNSLTKYQKISLAAALVILIAAGVAGLALRKAQGVDYSVEVTETVTRFGGVLKEVSLAADSQELARQMDQAFTAYLTPELLALWKADPAQAIGRAASSPWPVRIDVGTVSRNVDGTYTALGTVVEVTSESDTPAAVYPVALTLELRPQGWRIQDATKGAYIAVPERRTIDGTYVCLPSADLIESDSCAFGLRAKDGRHYALDFTVLQSSDIMSRLVTGERVRVEGTFVPAEHLSAGDYWTGYAVDAVVRVTSLSEL